jgi:hypothetical protein
VFKKISWTLEMEEAEIFDEIEDSNILRNAKEFHKI